MDSESQRALEKEVESRNPAGSVMGNNDGRVNKNYEMRIVVVI